MIRSASVEVPQARVQAPEPLVAGQQPLPVGPGRGERPGEPPGSGRRPPRRRRPPARPGGAAPRAPPVSPPSRVATSVSRQEARSWAHSSLREPPPTRASRPTVVPAAFRALRPSSMPKRHALQHRPDQLGRLGVVARGRTRRPGRPHRCGGCARRTGTAGTTGDRQSDSGSAARSSASSAASLRAPSSRAAQARQLAADSITLIWCHRPGRGVAEGVHGRLRVGPETVPSPRTARRWCPGTRTPGRRPPRRCPRRWRRCPPPPPAHHHRGRQAPGLGHRRQQGTGRLAALHQPGHVRPGQAGGLQQGLGPVPPGHVQPQGAGPRRSSRWPFPRSCAGAGSPWAAAPCPPGPNSSGSWRATQASLGAVKPGMARLPATCGRAGKRRVSSRHSSSARVSFQRIAGRSTRPSRSRRVAPCICPDRPTARTDRKAAGAWRRTRHDGHAGGQPPVLGILFRPAGVRPGNGKPMAGGR